MAWNAMEVAEMFQSGTVDQFVRNVGFDAQFLESVAEKIGYGGGLDVSGGADSGLDVSGGGMDVNGGGLDVSGGGMDVNGGGLDVSGDSLDVSGGGLDVSGDGLDVSGGGLDVNGGGLDVSGGGTGEEDVVYDEFIADLNRKRKRKAHPETWQQNIQRKKRALGEAYVSKKLLDGKWVSVNKPEKHMGDLCRKERCKNSKSRHCNEFSELDCQKVFDAYWGTGDKNVQNTFIISLVDVAAKTKATTETNSKRQFSRKYRLKHNGITKEVCKDMFLATLGIGAGRLECVLLNDKENVGVTQNIPKPRNPTPSRGFSWTNTDQEFLKNFFDEIPKAPGHYCRKDSKKIYLTEMVSSLAKLHDVYAARCAAFGKKAFSTKKFAEYFHENNFSLFKRKKDRCNKCMAYEAGNLTEEEFLAHQELKNEALSLKQVDKDQADNVAEMVITADTEALLTAPRNDSGLMFFHSKLNLHNLTFYDLFTKEVDNYLWSEVNGDIKANNFTSCYIDFLTKALEKHPSLTSITVWSDGCSGQNRCSVLGSALLTLAVERNVTFTHKYLEVGHTHMECDSVHSNIERKKKETNINVPADYINVIRSARKRPSKYGVTYVDHTFFKNYEACSDVPTLKPSKTTGRPYVLDIRMLRYNPDGTIEYNLTYKEENWTTYQQNFNLRHMTPAPLYLSPLKISHLKWEHLQVLKASIPKEYHAFYNNLEYIAPKEKSKND